MKIKFLNTDKAAQSFDTKLITIGREDDNLLQILSDGISRHHGRIYCDEKNDWYIEDLGSTNGIKLNGEKISAPALLHENDIVDLHQEKIQIYGFNEYNTVLEFNADEIAKISSSDVITQDASNEISVDPIIIAPVQTAYPAPEVENNTAQKENELEKLAEFIHQNTGDLFNNSKEKQSDKQQQFKSDKTKQKFSNKLFYITLVCVCIVIGAFLIKILEDKNKPAKSSRTTAVQKDYPLYLRYIKENISPDNVFRFTLTIENNEASFSVDDLRSQLRYGPIVKAISDTELAKMKLSINESMFMQLAPVEDGIYSNNEREFKELEIHYGLKNNTITLKNRPAPREFMDIEEAINVFAESCNMATFSLSPEELQEQALVNYRMAEDKFANYETNLSYLREAVYNYNLVIEYLSGITPEPKMRRDAAEKMKRANDIRNNWIKQYRSQFSTMINKEDLSGAKNALENLLLLYDMNTKEYQNTKLRLIRVDMVSRKIKSGK